MYDLYRSSVDFPSRLRVGDRVIVETWGPDGKLSEDPGVVDVATGSYATVRLDDHRLVFITRAQLGAKYRVRREERKL